MVHFNGVPAGSKGQTRVGNSPSRSNSTAAPGRRSPRRRSTIPTSNRDNSDANLRPIDLVLSRLKNVRRSGTGWSARCPSHADWNNSLAVSEAEDGNVLMYCHAGCDIKDVVDKIQLEMRQLFVHGRGDHATRPGPRLDRAVPPNMTALAQQLRAAIDDNQIRQLAEQLGVSPNSLKRLHIGWSAEQDAYSFPECDHYGRVVGIHLRRLDGSKFSVTGGHRGLIMATNKYEMRSKLLVPEGMSDTAALLDIGAVVVGRPSATGGAEHLIALARKFELEMFIVGENDCKDDGHWPGKIGARRVAERIAMELGRRVYVTMPRELFKDVRDMIVNGESINV